MVLHNLIIFSTLVVMSTCFLKSEYKCDNQQLPILCYQGTIEIIKAEYGRWDSEKCGHSSNINCYSSSAKNKVLQQCHGKEECNINVNPQSFGNPCPGTKKYLEVIYKCNPTASSSSGKEKTENGQEYAAQYRQRSAPAAYANPPIGHATELKCDFEQLPLLCYQGTIDIIRADYGRWDTSRCGQSSVVNCYSTIAKQKVQQQCQGKATCNLNVNPHDFGNPCPSTKKYLEVAYRCNPSSGAPQGSDLQNVHYEQQTPVSNPQFSMQSTPNVYSVPQTPVHSDPEYRSPVNANTNSLIVTDLKCDFQPMQIFCYEGTIEIIKAAYGRWDTEKCGHSSVVNCYSAIAKDKILQLCQGRGECNLNVNPQYFGNPCPNTKKYLEVAYKCIPTSQRVQRNSYAGTKTIRTQ